MANYIFDANYLKQSTVINDNVDDKLISQAILDVQRMHIEELLGTALYSQIMTQIAANSVSANNQTLLDNYVVPCMRQYVLAECAWMFQYKFWNKGILTSSSDNSQTVDFSTIKFIMDQYRNKAEKLAEICTKYLRDNTATYTLYLSNTEPYQVQPNKNNYTTGLFLDSDEQTCNYNNLDT
jgi:hypothetical protein